MYKKCKKHILTVGVCSIQMLVELYNARGSQGGFPHVGICWSFDNPLRRRNGVRHNKITQLKKIAHLKKNLHTILHHFSYSFKTQKGLQTSLV